MVANDGGTTEVHKGDGSNHTGNGFTSAYDDYCQNATTQGWDRQMSNKKIREAAIALLAETHSLVAAHRLQNALNEHKLKRKKKRCKWYQYSNSNGIWYAISCTSGPNASVIPCARNHCHECGREVKVVKDQSGDSTPSNDVDRRRYEAWKRRRRHSSDCKD